MLLDEETRRRLTKPHGRVAPAVPKPAPRVANLEASLLALPKLDSEFVTDDNLLMYPWYRLLGNTATALRPTGINPGVYMGITFNALGQATDAVASGVTIDAPIITNPNINGGSIRLPISGLHVLGGASGYTIETDGLGNLTWAPAGGFPEAPGDGRTYGRDGATASWNAVLPLAGGALTGPLTVNGNVTVTGSLINPSHARLKDDIKPWGKGLDEVLGLKPISFRYKGRSDVRYGVLAEDTERVLPELVSERGVDVGSLVFVLINAVKQLADRVDQLEMKGKGDAFRAE